MTCPFYLILGLLLGFLLHANLGRIEASIWNLIGRLPGVEIEVMSRKELDRWNG